MSAWERWQETECGCRVSEYGRWQETEPEGCVSEYGRGQESEFVGYVSALDATRRLRRGFRVGFGRWQDTETEGYVSEYECMRTGSRSFPEITESSFVLASAGVVHVFERTTNTPVWPHR